MFRQLIEEVRWVCEGGGSRKSKAERQRKFREKSLGKTDTATFNQIARAGSKDTKRLWISRERQHARHGSTDMRGFNTGYNRKYTHEKERGVKKDRQGAIDRTHAYNLRHREGQHRVWGKEGTPQGRKDKLKVKYADKRKLRDREVD
jgi:hypothetical protein